MSLIFLNIFLVGAGLLVWLLIRATPRTRGPAVDNRGVFERWLTSRLPEKIDSFVRTIVLRTLHRVKVFVMRLGNGIDQKLQRMKLESGESMGSPKQKIDLKKVREGRRRHDGKRSSVGGRSKETVDLATDLENMGQGN